MRLNERVAIVVGAGQSPEGVGNGRATAITFAREGARVLCVDRNFASAHETVAMVEDARARWGRIDVLHNNSASASQAAMQNCSISRKPRSTAASRTTSAAQFSRANTSFQSCGHNAAARSSTFRRWPRSRAIRTSRTRRRRRR